MAAQLSEESLGKMFADLPSYRTLPLPVALASLYLPGDVIKAGLTALITTASPRCAPERCCRAPDRKRPSAAGQQCRGRRSARYLFP